MKKWICITSGFLFMIISQFSLAQRNTALDNKVNQAISYERKSNNPEMAWKATVEIAGIIKQQPQYDDGAIGEGIVLLVSELLAKPWKYSEPYLIGSKSTPELQKFIVHHVNEMAGDKILKQVQKNIETHCEPAKYPVCKQLLLNIKNVVR